MTDRTLTVTGAGLAGVVWIGVLTAMPWGVPADGEKPRHSTWRRCWPGLRSDLPPCEGIRESDPHGGFPAAAVAETLNVMNRGSMADLKEQETEGRGRVRVGGRPAPGAPEGLIGDAAAKGAVR